ncbi:hypothetical protein Ddye_017646 [Dipteronia dyeriana]|uniref:BAG domain-containing protein n=1 Tax=Dipteronia dyeriana TaxID=168575 RepID=A0AAD9U9V3_9ROSI|nr:hypothetical protein Ddye_017646 [Dipteronia dyeriana]
MTEGTRSAESADNGRWARIKDLSDVEAATLIQSAYREFEVRKLEPLKKLKQMVTVREQLAEGLHPTLREFRKALAKELVTLQEKLDSLMMKKPKESFEDVSNTKPADDPNIDTHSDLSIQETQNEAGIVENSLQTSHENDVNMKEQDQGNLSQGQEISEQPSLASYGALGRCETEVRELPLTIAENTQVAEVVATEQLDGEASHKDLGGTQDIMAETKERNDVLSELEQSVDLPSISEEKTSSQEFTNALLQGSSCDPDGEEDGNKVAIKNEGTYESTEL